VSFTGGLRGPVEAVIFDFDETLVLSQKNYQHAAEAFLARRGVSISETDWNDFVGFGMVRMLTGMKERFNLNGSFDELMKEKVSLYLEVARESTASIPQTRRLVELLYEYGIPLAIASGSYRNVIEELSDQAGIRRYFSRIVSDQDILNGKPEPDIFLAASRALSIPPGRCVVVEDSLSGVIAAAQAGMQSIAAPSRASFLKDTRFSPDVLIPGGMQDLDPEEIFQEISRVYAGSTVCARDD
jgi:HAD superfamily hydrolase (TIGR01509 family)